MDDDGSAVKTPTGQIPAIYAEIGRRIRQARITANVTQDALAKRLNLSRTSVTNIEKGRQKIFVHMLLNVAHQLHTDGASLLPQSDGAHKIQQKLTENLSDTERRFVLSVVAGKKVK